MEVILLQRIKKLGQIGDVVKVKDGYARNYLIPNNKVLKANEVNKALFIEQKAHIEAENLKLKAEAEKLVSKLTNLEIVVVRTAGEAGHLYGSVSTKDITTSLSKEKISINKDQINLINPIKMVGVFVVNISLHAEVAVNIYVNVARSVEEAKTQMNLYLNPPKEKKAKEKFTKEVKVADSLDAEEDNLENMEAGAEVSKEESKDKKSKTTKKSQE
jgi:large subunit ribosomal protein L9